MEKIRENMHVFVLSYISDMIMKAQNMSGC